MQAKLQSIKVELIVVHNDQFTIQHTTIGQVPAQRFDQFRKIAIEWFLIAALDQDFITITEYQGTESIPLGLEYPSSVCRDIVHALGEHRQHRRIDRKVHLLML